jgi:hypothetical protein
MSTAKFDTLSTLDGSQSVPVNTVAQGSAKAWVNFNGTGTVAIRAAFNVASITDGGTGTYTLNLTNALSDTSYSVVAGGAITEAATAGMFSPVTGNYTTTSLKILTLTASAVSDNAIVNVAIFR